MTTYRCSACAVVCDSWKRLKKHQSRVHFRCSVCLVYLASREELVKHWIITQHQYYCPACKKGLDTEEGLRDHSCDPRDITCPVCKMISPSQEIYDQHWKDARKDGRHQSGAYVHNSRSCKDTRCQKTFKTVELFKAHLRQVNGCQRCHVHFSNDNNLRMHRISHQPADQTCVFTDCHKNFPSYSAMLKHIEIGTCVTEAHQSITRSLAQSQVADTCVHSWALNAAADSGYDSEVPGFEWEDEDDLPYFCEECDRDFRHLSALFSHWEQSQTCSGGYEDGYIESVKKALLD